VLFGSFNDDKKFTRVTRRVAGTACTFGAHEFTTGFNWFHVAPSFSQIADPQGEVYDII